jgi:hypothetical protein
MKRLLTLVLVSVSLSVGATLLATWASMMIRTAREHQVETVPETANS